MNNQIRQSIANGEKVLAQHAFSNNIMWISVGLLFLVALWIDLYIAFPLMFVLAVITWRAEQNLTKLDQALIEARRSL